MDFRKNGKEPNKATVVFSEAERSIINAALLKTVIDASIEGGVQLPRTSVVHRIARILLAPQNTTGLIINNWDADHLTALADSVITYQQDVGYDRVGKVASLAAELGAAANILKGATALASETSIDEIVKEFNIPDNLDNLGS